MTSPIKVQRGVLQGDSLSPLLFNLIVNTLINKIKSEKVECMSYVYNGHQNTGSNLRTIRRLLQI